MSKWQEAADTYQKSITMKPDVAANYNNLGNTWRSWGKSMMPGQLIKSTLT